MKDDICCNNVFNVVTKNACATKPVIDEFDLVSRDKPISRRSSCGKWNVINSTLIVMCTI